MSSNKEVANILDAPESKSAEKKNETKVNIDEAAWGEEDDLDIDDDIMGDTQGDQMGDAPATEDSDIFVPPSPGADPLLAVLRQNPQSAPL